MWDFSPETKEWLQKARQAERPFGVVCRNGTYLISLVRSESFAIADKVIASGFACWRAVDPSRGRKLNIYAKPKSGRIRWDLKEQCAKDETLVEKQIVIPTPHPEGGTLDDIDESCHFFVVTRGYEQIETWCANTDNRHVYSRFFADRSRTENNEDKENEMSHDWLGAIAEGVKGLPGGEIFLGPLLKLREDDKTQQRNEQIDRMFEQNKALDEQALKSLFGLHEESAEIKVLLQLAVDRLNAAFNKEKGMPDETLTLSEFPLPFDKGLLIQELMRLWTNPYEIQVCLRQHNYDDIEATKSGEFIIQFVDSMPGNSQNKLADVFRCLSAKRADSKILKFAAQFLSAPRAQ